MARTLFALLLPLCLLSACGEQGGGGGSSPVPWSTKPATGTASPATPPAPPADPAKPPADPAKPPVEPAKPPVEPAKPPVEPAKPPVAPGARDRLTLDDIRALLELGVDETEIRQVVRAAKSVALTEADVEALRALDVGEGLLAEVRRRLTTTGGRNPLEVVLGMLGEKPEAEILDWILTSGRTVQLSAADVLKLTRAGASKNVVLALRGQWVPEGYKVYRDPLRAISLQYPASWNTFEWFRDEILWIVITPERDVPEPNHFTTGLQLQVSPVDETSLLERVGIVEMHRRSLPAILLGNRKYGLAAAQGPEGEIRPRTIAGHQGVEQGFTATMLGTRCREKMARVVAEGMDFFLEFFAPEEKFTGLAPEFERMLATARPFPDQVDLVRRDEPMDRTELHERYKESVVMVLAQYEGATGFGTGFVVREDGLVLTNWHVVHNEGVPADRIEIVWDASVGPKKPGEKHRREEAVLVDTVMEEWPMTDVALLRVPRGKEPYKALPLLPIRSGLVKPEDEVIAMGFPVPTSMRQIGELITTNGHLSRVNCMPGVSDPEAPGARLDDAVVDITINQGNSGGPCVHLRTGGVIGLNTRIVLAPGIVGGQAQKLEYGRVCLTDHVLRQFPQIRWYPRDRAMRPVEHLELAAILMSRGNLRPAEEELRLAEQGIAELDAPQRARLYQQYARFWAARGDDAAAATYLERALDADPSHLSTLRELAYRNATPALFDKASEYLRRIIDLRPDDFFSHHTAAEVCRVVGRYPEALEHADKALSLGGGYDPAVHRTKALALWSTGELDAAEATYREGLRADPNDYLTKVSLGNLFVAKEDLAAAQSWFSRAVAEHPDEPVVRQGYADVLRGQAGRTAEAAKEYLAALRLCWDRGTKPPADLLTSIAEVGVDETEDPEITAQALNCSIELFRSYPDRRSTAHALLSRYWTRRGAGALVRAHDCAGDPGTSPALSLGDLSTAIEAGYPAELVADLLTCCAVNFPLNDDFKAAYQSDAWTQGHIDAVVGRVVFDMVNGSPALGRDLLQIESEGGFDSAGDAPSIVWKVTNAGGVPLTGIVLRLEYLDEAGNVIFTGDKPLSSVFLPLLPGEVIRGVFPYHAWDVLRANGVTPENLNQIRRSVVLARNAFFLQNVRVEGEMTPEGYRFSIVNDGVFVLRAPKVLCTFRRGGEDVILNPARANTPITAAQQWEAVTVPPGTRSEVLLAPEWGSREYLLQTLGLPESEFGGATIHVYLFDAEAALPE